MQVKSRSDIQTGPYSMIQPKPDKTALAPCVINILTHPDRGRAMPFSRSHHTEHYTMQCERVSTSRLPACSRFPLFYHTRLPQYVVVGPIVMCKVVVAWLRTFNCCCGSGETNALRYDLLSIEMLLRTASLDWIPHRAHMAAPSLL